MRPIHTLLAASALAFGIQPAIAQTVGVTAAVNQSARGTPPRQAVRTLVIGENVVHNERIETDTGGLLQILLADGTAFTVGPNSALSIDRFVYDPNAGTAQVSASLTKGVFRFIGGRTSKTPGGVSLGTPVGTIGIRGAVVDVNLTRSRGSAGNVEAHIDMIFGDEVVLNGPGGTDRIYEPGYSIIIRQTADGGRSQEVAKTPASFRSEIQQSLAGAAGTTGGARSAPTETTVVESRVAAENSDRTPAMNSLPIPEPRPERVADLDEAVVADAGSDLVRETVEEVVDRPDEPEEPQEPQEPQEPEEPEEPTVVPVRVVTAGATYLTNANELIENPGQVGLIGGSSDTDQRSNLIVPAGSARGTAALPQGPLVLPVFTDTGFTAHAILQTDGASLNGIPLTGTAYSDADGFTAYALALNGDVTEPLYALRGTPIANLSVLRSGDVRTYSFTPDMLQGLPVPFTDATVLGTDYAGVSSSDFYVIEPASTAERNPIVFQSWLLVSGEGPTQRSGIGVNIGEMFADDGNQQFQFSRRGSLRADPFGFSSLMSGGVGTVSGPSGGNEIFGANGQNIVLAGQFDVNDYFADSNTFITPASRFSTLHVLGLENEVPLSQFVEDRGSTRMPAATGNVTIRGFAAGLVEIGREDGIYTQVLANSGSDPNLFFLGRDAERGTIGGQLTVIDTSGTAAAHIAFGTGTNGNNVDGPSVYIDDDLFAATGNRDPESSFLVETDDEVTTVYRQSRNVSLRTYLVSGDANPQPDFLPNGQLCACKFLEWGWWGTQIRSGTDPANPESEDLRANVHLGTWVAGDVTRNQQLADLAGTSAHYEGSAVGHVSTALDGGVADYVASGTMNMDYDFGSRAGAMAINDFDGRNFSGAVNGNSFTDDALFSGGLTQDNLDASGTVSGAFVNDGASVAAGVIGNFALQSGTGDWAAVGILGGARGPQQ
jgi:hypothetical protein